MHKASWKNRTVPLYLGLLIVSMPAAALYSDDPDCKPVSDAAKMSAVRASSRIDDTATKTGQTVATAKSCVDQVISEANRAVPDFGGDIAGSLGSFVTSLLAKKGCQMFSNAQSQVTSSTAAVSTAAPSASGTALGSLVSGGSSASAPAAPSIMQRIANLF
jgi:hypothetical protein